MTARKVTLETVFRWLQEGVFEVHEGGKIYKGDRLLAQRINPRNRMKEGDPRVDLFHESVRRSCHVSQLIWMFGADQAIPEGFEIHHRDEDCLNNDFSNLICVCSMDHSKLHKSLSGLEESEEEF